MLNVTLHGRKVYKLTRAWGVQEGSQAARRHKVGLQGRGDNPTQKLKLLGCVGCVQVHLLGQNTVTI